MSKSEVTFHGSDSANVYIRPTFALFFFICMLYCAQKLWKARNIKLSAVKQIFGLSALFFGIKSLSWLSELIGTPLFLADLFVLWPSFIQASAVERLASTWLEVYFTFSSALTKQHLSQRVAQVSMCVNIAVHMTFLVSYCILYEVIPLMVGLVMRVMLVVFMVYVTCLMTVSVCKISKVIEEFFGPKPSRKVKLIGIFTVVSFTLSIAVNVMLTVLTPKYLYYAIKSTGSWLSIVLTIEYALQTIVFMLVITRAIVAESNKNVSVEGYAEAPDTSKSLSSANSLDSNHQYSPKPA